ncbi:OmpA family protein [Fluviicola sp.]|uniref:OmpA family protein n=1 Tax=Fluviicola sp. TaxID=1917219 RepID=UPI0031DD5438
MRSQLNQLLLVVMSLSGCAVYGQSLLKETRQDSISVFFETGNYTIKKPQLLLSKINGIEKQALGKIMLIGYTDSVGSQESNRALASRRILSVLKILETSALKDYLIDSLNLNESKDKGMVSGDYFRRVDVIVYQVEPNFVLDKTVRLNIQFQGGGDYVLASSFESMKELLSVMKLDPSLKIRLNGHVCCAPDQLLSLNRAKRVKSFLVKNGIDEKRIACFGYSNSVKLVEEVSPEAQAINRRVEVVFSKD